MGCLRVVWSGFLRFWSAFAAVTFADKPPGLENVNEGTHKIEVPKAPGKWPAQPPGLPAINPGVRDGVIDWFALWIELSYARGLPELIDRIRVPVSAMHEGIREIFSWDVVLGCESGDVKVDARAELVFVVWRQTSGVAIWEMTFFVGGGFELIGCLIVDGDVNVMMCLRLSSLRRWCVLAVMLCMLCVLGKWIWQITGWHECNIWSKTRMSASYAIFDFVLSIVVLEQTIDEEDPLLGKQNGELQQADAEEVVVCNSYDELYEPTVIGGFDELGFCEELLTGLYVEMSFEKPSKIQGMSLPMICKEPYSSLVAQVNPISTFNGDFFLISHTPCMFRPRKCMLVVNPPKVANRNS